ncbi:transcriptional regulator [Pilimelia anulata]|uniref:Transcriptional regulator n=1 Tax=Pilimelia anulata TaxID=53371 RepID=A0A8J3FD61_9ACTN|nr:helix-turn-helix transcriptional regulator [Pilimelia anulata]GGJ94805.1 transcriptional regulator [Pilimelia anulata]
MAAAQEPARRRPGPAAGPTVVRRQLGRQLRRLREAAGGETVEQVAAHPELGLSRAKLYRLERGQHAVKPQDVAVLCRYYRVGDRQTDKLIALALATQQDSWWHALGDVNVPEWFSLYLDLEPAASAIRTYEAELVPGLLQTADYAREIHRVHNPGLSADQVEQRVAVRMERQLLLDRPGGPASRFVLNEATLLRSVGGPAVMRRQIEQVRRMGESANVVISVLRFDVGVHPGMHNPFVILDFADPAEDPPVVYVETVTSAGYLQKDSDVRDYAAIFEQIEQQATPIQEYVT